MNIDLQWSEPALSVMKSCFPTPPNQGAVGQPPSGYLAILRSHVRPTAGKAPVEILYPCVTEKCDRGKVRAICQDSRVDVLEAYAVAMAWGGQHRRWFRTSIACPELGSLLVALRTSSNLRDQDFATAKLKSGDILGLGISYFTKLLYFFRSHGNCYILDQWTAKSMFLLRSGVVRIDGDMPARDTTAEEYVMFCEMCEGLTREFPGWTPEQIEQAMFDRPGGGWRSWVKSCFSTSSKQQGDPGEASSDLEEEGGGGFIPPEDPQQSNDEDDGGEDPRELILKGIEEAHCEHFAVGMPLPPGILRRSATEVWPGGGGGRVSDIKWFYRVKRRPMVIEVGVLFARAAIHFRDDLITANPDGKWFGSATAGPSGNKISVESPWSHAIPVADISEVAVSTMSLLYSLVKRIAAQGGISHPQLR